MQTILLRFRTFALCVISFVLCYGSFRSPAVADDGGGRGAALSSPATSTDPQLTGLQVTRTLENSGPAFDEVSSGPTHLRSANTIITVLPNSNEYSLLTSVPQATQRYQRMCWLIKPSEMLASGFKNGDTVTSLGFSIYVVPNVAATGNVQIYLENTADTTWLKASSTWSNVISPMTAVDNASFTFSRSVVPMDIPFVNGSTFVYTGGGVYVAYEYSNPSGSVATIPDGVFSTSSSGGSGGTRFTSSTSSMGSSLSSVTASRPETRFGNTKYGLQVVNLYAPGKLPITDGNPAAMSVLVRNISLSASTFNLIRTIKDSASGTLRLRDTVTVSNMRAVSESTIAFSGWTAANTETDSITVQLPVQGFESDATNNSAKGIIIVNKNTFSYVSTDAASGGIGVAGNTGIYAAKFTASGARRLTSVKVNFQGSGQAYQILVFNATGTGGTPGAILTSSDLMISSVGTTDVPLNSRANMSGVFYVGVKQVGTTNFNLGYQTESPVRPSTFYSLIPAGATTWSELRTVANPYRLAIQAVLENAHDLQVTAITNPTDGSTLLGGSFVPTATVANNGANDENSAPVAMQILRSGTVVYADTQYISISKDASQTVTFKSANLANGFLYNVKVSTLLSNDDDTSTDTASIGFYQLGDEVTNADTAITVSGTGENSRTVHWRGGNAAKRLVIVKAGSAVDVVPNDGWTYPANSAPGYGYELNTGDFAVFTGAGDSATITGLVKGKTYYVAVFGYNGVSGTENYRTDVYPTSSFTMPGGYSSLPGSALVLDGVDDNVYNDSPTGLPTGSTATVEAWVYPTGYTDATYNGIVSFGSRDCGSPGGTFALGVQSTGLLSFAGWCDDLAPSTGTPLTLNAWNHVACVVSDTTVTFYVNGEVAGGGVLPTGLSLVAGPLCVGSTDYITGRNFQGKIDEVRIWNTARTQKEIRENMHQCFSTAQPGLALYWQFVEGGGTLTTDPVNSIDGTVTNYEAPSPNSWSTSPIPAGPATVYSVDTITADPQSMPGVDLSFTNGYDTPSDLMVAQISTAPNMIPTSGSTTYLSDRYWVIRPFGTPGTYSQNATFTVPSEFTLDGSAGAALYTLYYRPVTSIGNWGAVTSANNLTASSVTFNGLTAGGQYMIGTTEALPIQLGEFTANASGTGNIQIAWTTMTETKTYGFYVERRLFTGRVFTRVSELIPGAGTTLEEHHYSWTDTQADGKNYVYRLRTVDLDGSVTFSPEIIVNGTLGVGELPIPKEFGLQQNYPNPFNPSTSIRYELPVDSRVSVKVFNVLGQQVAELANGIQSAGYKTLSLDASRFASGIYFYHLDAVATGDPSRTFTKVRKMILLK